MACLAVGWGWGVADVRGALVSESTWSHFCPVSCDVMGDLYCAGRTYCYGREFEFKTKLENEYERANTQYVSEEDILNNINKLIESLWKINKDAKIYFIEIPSIAFRMDRNKEEIFRLNEYLKNNLDKTIKYIEINKYMIDDFGNLKLEYTYDGLHFNKEGYKILKKILEKEI